MLKSTSTQFSRRPIAAHSFPIRTMLALACLCASVGASAHPDTGEATDIEKVNGSIHTEAGHRYGRLETVNGSIRIEAGTQAASAETVNGSIRVESSARLGSAETVNGSIKVAERASTGGLETVNGSVKLGERVRVDGGIETVSGGVFVDRQGNISRDVETVNGSIGLVDSDVGGGIGTVNGDITVGAGSHVRGGIVVEKANTNWMPISIGKPNRRIPRIVIGPNARVDGPLRFEREVKLYVHSTATIGPVQGASPVRYTSARAPVN